MACTAADKAAKAEKPHIPEINWSADKSSAVWALLQHIEKAENYCVLHGRKSVEENTSGKTKATVYTQIAEAILPKWWWAMPVTGLSALRDETGEGVQANEGDSQGSGETLSYYISGEGPCVETPLHAVNIWKEIEKEFPFFPTLHCIYAYRPNVTPIVITTALGPQGSRTVWYQPPDNNSNIDPRLLNKGPREVAQTPQQERSFGNDADIAVKQNVPGPTPGPQRGPKPSSAARDAMENACQTVSKVPQKRSLADTLMEIQRENLAAQKSQNQSHINLELRKQIIDKVKVGLWTIEEAQKKIKALKNDHSPRPKKHQRKAVCEVSPDWEDFSSDLEDV
ncbi:hypothetical protein B0H34DRAFT_663721 [Crassisporium funariophilum]|nr:hypothetical protein B0H34DRAFT_663721 [Crassisporium funariophilum]